MFIAQLYDNDEKKCGSMHVFVTCMSIHYIMHIIYNREIYLTQLYECESKRLFRHILAKYRMHDFVDA